MKIIIVGADTTHGIERYYIKYLRESGAEVLLFAAQNLFYEYYQKGLHHKILFRAGVSPIYPIINFKLKKQISKEKPDIVWVFKGMEIYPSTLRWIRAQKIKLINYNPDNPFLFSGRGSGNKNVTNAIGEYDFYFTYNQNIKSQLEEQYSAKTYFLPFGYEIPDGVYEHCASLPELRKVCFMGNPDQERALSLIALASRGIAVTVFGHGWSKHVDHPEIEIQGPLEGIKLWETLRQYRVQLNFMRPHNMDSHNMRTFEVPGIGGVMLAPRNREHSLFFREGKEAFFYSDLNECVQQIDYILNLPQETVSEIRKAARERSVLSGYSYADRAGEVLREMKRIVGE